MRSMQVPPFWHGWDRHSLISSEQFTPWYPATHCAGRQTRGGGLWLGGRLRCGPLPTVQADGATPQATLLIREGLSPSHPVGPEGDPCPADSDKLRVTAQSSGQNVSCGHEVEAPGQVSAEPGDRALGEGTQMETPSHIPGYSFSRLSPPRDASTRQSSLIITALPYWDCVKSGLVLPTGPARGPGPATQCHSQPAPLAPRDGSPPRRSSRQGSRCRWPHSGRGWASTRPPGPRSSCPCSRPGSDSDACCPRPCRAPRSGTGG